MILWLKVTKDEYQLPLAVADTAAELARMTGVKPDSLYSMRSHGVKEYIKVEVEDDIL